MKIEGDIYMHEHEQSIPIKPLLEQQLHCPPEVFGFPAVYFVS
jgi:hypothetical protein